MNKTPERYRVVLAGALAGPHKIFDNILEARAEARRAVKAGDTSAATIQRENGDVTEHVETHT